MQAEVLREVSHYPVSLASIRCEFCNRQGEWDIETMVEGKEKSIWICGECPNSKIILKNWEIIK